MLSYRLRSSSYVLCVLVLLGAWPTAKHASGDESLCDVGYIAKMWQSQEVDSGLSSPKPEFLPTDSALA